MGVWEPVLIERNDETFVRVGPTNNKLNTVLGKQRG